MRESDIHEEWVALPGPGFDLITRACSDRSLAGGGLLFAAAAGWSAAGEATIEIVARRDRVARKARLVLKFGEVTIRKPAARHTEGCAQRR